MLKWLKLATWGGVLWEYEEPIPPFNIKDVNNWASGRWGKYAGMGIDGVWYRGDSYNRWISTKNKVRFATASKIKFGLNERNIDTYNIPAVEVVSIGFYDSNQNFIGKKVNTYNTFVDIPNNSYYYTFTVTMNGENQNLQTQLTRLNPTVEFL